MLTTHTYPPPTAHTHTHTHTHNTAHAHTHTTQHTHAETHHIHTAHIHAHHTHTVTHLTVVASLAPPPTSRNQKPAGTSDDPATVRLDSDDATHTPGLILGRSWTVVEKGRGLCTCVRW